MYAIYLSGKNRSCCWASCSSRLTLFRKCTCVLRIFFNAEAIIASSMSKSGQFFPVIDRDVIRSLIVFAISTSLIQSMVTWGSALFWQTSALVFQLWNSVESGNFPRFHSTIEIVGSNKFPLYGIAFHFCFGSEVLQSMYSTNLFSFHHFVLMYRQASGLNLGVNCGRL